MTILSSDLKLCADAINDVTGGYDKMEWLGFPLRRLSGGLDPVRAIKPAGLVSAVGDSIGEVE